MTSATHLVPFQIDDPRIGQCRVIRVMRNNSESAMLRNAFFYWNQGVIYCTCGQFLVDSESRRKFHKLRLDALYPALRDQEGATPWCSTRHIAWNAWKRCCKRVDSQGEHFIGIHDRFLRDQVYRESQLEEMDELAKQNHTYHLSTEEFKRYQEQWYLTLSVSQAKTRLCDFDQIFELQSLSKTVFIVSPASRLQNQFLHTNAGNGTIHQAMHDWTRPTGGSPQ